PSGRIARWLLKLSQYEFDVLHRAGRLHANADALSRLPAPSTTTTTAKSSVEVAANGGSTTSTSTATSTNCTEGTCSAAINAFRLGTAVEPREYRLKQLNDEIFAFVVRARETGSTRTTGNCRRKQGRCSPRSTSSR